MALTLANGGYSTAMSDYGCPGRVAHILGRNRSITKGYQSRELDSALNQYEVALFCFKFYLVFLGASCFFFQSFLLVLCVS